jgi:DnaD/phage-associated family protein
VKYEIVYKDGAVCLPAGAFDACDSIHEIRFLMLLSYERSLCDADDVTLTEQLGCTPEELHETVEALRKKGLLGKEKKAAPTEANKNLSGETIAACVEENKALKQLIEESERMMVRVFTPTEISKLVSLNTNLGLECDTIYLMLCYHMEKLDSVGKKITVSYLEKSAYSLYNEGVRTTEQLQKYIKDSERRNSAKYKLAKMFDMGDRPFTKKQKTFFEKWLTEWEMPTALIECAYEISVNNTGKASLEYMSKIMSDWHDSGVTTVEQAEKASESFKSSSQYVCKFKEKPSEDGNGGEKSFNTDEFFEKALKRSYAWMNTIKKDGEGES